MDKKVGAQYFREQETHIGNKCEDMVNSVSDQKNAN